MAAQAGTGAYRVMADGVQQALYDRGYTGDIRQDAYAVLDVVLPEIVAFLRSAPHRPWSEDDADSAESRSARAYNYALVIAANTVEGLLDNADEAVRDA
jgi:hypothetical protein